MIKESSDELNPSVVTGGVTITTTSSSGRRTAGDYLALAVATCGVGYLPLAPGTWGSLVGVFLYVSYRELFGILLRRSSLLFPFVMGGVDVYDLVKSLQQSSMIILIAGVTIAGTWAATRAEKLLGRKDPGAVVIDEVAGQLIAFLPLSVPMVKFNWWLIVAGFLFFRAFDIWKPYPIRRLESLGGGLGIMADDVLAGIYAAILLALLTSIYLLI